MKRLAILALGAMLPVAGLGCNSCHWLWKGPACQTCPTGCDPAAIPPTTTFSPGGTYVAPQTYPPNTTVLPGPG